MKFKLNITSKIGLIVLFLLILVLANLRYKQYKSQKEIENEKLSLQKQIATLNEKNKNLSDSLSYLGSSDFKERVAREQLNLKRDGEVVFGFSDAPQQTIAEDASGTQNVPNYQKWIEYFFGSN